ncbi:hypothetical protein ABZ883_19785 [Streptomyces sp. NPDC046977]|uniref:hypothetical protein n=1 Tax=Streptomyces sp. NPDC046977 TaxID=3154703 RepID=UPI00340F4D54
MTGRDSRESATDSADAEPGPHAPHHAPGHDRRSPADRTSPHAAAPGHDKWLVGLETRTTDGRRLWLFYIVNQACDAGHAVHQALVRANSAAERAARDGAFIKGGRAEVHQIHRDHLGRLSLVRRI